MEHNYPECRPPFGTTFARTRVTLTLSGGWVLSRERGWELRPRYASASRPSPEFAWCWHYCWRKRADHLRCAHSQRDLRSYTFVNDMRESTALHVPSADSAQMKSFKIYLHQT